MAIPEVTTRPSPAQVQSASTTAINREASCCSYCERPIAKCILAARKPYCGKLCAALGLIVDVHEEDGIFPDTGPDALASLVEGIFYEGPILTPVKVRFSDSIRAIESDFFNGAAAHRAIVEIEDDGTPDWIPDPILDADQDDIDGAVERLLTQEPTGGEEARR